MVGALVVGVSDKHDVNALRQRATFRRHYQLPQLCPLVRCLSEDAAKILIQAFINTRWITATRCTSA